jgi:hypothetical protein
MDKKKSLREHLERMKYVSKYAISETPKYKALVGDSGFDSLPEYLKEAPSGDTAAPTAQPQGGADAAAGLPPLPDEAPAAGGASPQPAPSAAPVQGSSGAPSNPEANANVDITTTAPAEQPVSQQPAPMQEPVETPEQTQKRVMELQLDALRKMSYKIEDLGSAVDNLNQRMEVYSSEVDKVREPSDMEKFENRKIDSSPYYFNLNDLWDKDNFKSRMDQFSKGYVKTEDGYVADFDDLPKMAPHEVKASFDV